jgi:CRISPR-associated protein Cmr2
MGSKATISFGLVIAHHSVPLAIALESLWQAEEEAKEHLAVIDLEPKQKDAVQVRVLFGNGNTLSATSKFEVFHYWQELLETLQNLEVKERNSLSALLEQAAQTWKDHPAPLNKDAIEAWTRAFCQRREILNNQVFLARDFPSKLQEYLIKIIAQTQPQDCDSEIQNWLKLAAFVLRNREIKLVNTQSVSN